MTYSLAQLKRDFKAENICSEMLVFCGGETIPKRLQGIRKAAGANTVAIFFRNNDVAAQKSELQIPRATLAKYTGDYLITYYPGVRDLTAEEQAVVDGWQKVADTAEFKERSRIDALTDGSSTYWQEKAYFLQSPFPYLFFGTDEVRGCKRITGRADHGKIRDSNIPGKVQNVYRLFKCDEDEPAYAPYPNWRCYSYFLEDENNGLELSLLDLKEHFYVDGTDVAICIVDYGVYKAGDICRVRQGSDAERGGFYIKTWK